MKFSVALIGHQLRCGRSLSHNGPDFTLSGPTRWLRHECIGTRDQFHSRIAAKSVFAATLILIGGSLFATGEETRVIFEEDFERYTNTANLRAVWPQGAGVLELRAPGGGQAARYDGGDANRRGDFSVLPGHSHAVVLTADLFDFATNANRHMTLAVGNRNRAFVELGVVSDGGVYAARTLDIGGKTREWTAFKTVQKRVRGWHRFQLVISPSNTVATLDLDANGKVDGSVTLEGPPPGEALTEVRFGALSDGVSPGGPVLIDNIRLELVPVGPPVVLAQNAVTTGTASPVANPDTAGNPPANLAVGAATSNAVVWWIMGALALIIGLLAWLVLALRRGGLGTSTALLPATGNPPTLTHEKALAELTAFAKQSLVQGLYEQRNALLETQKQAQQALIEMEQRLAALHLPQQERIRAYERRIAELEKELETRGEEVRELTQATLLLVRRKLEEEKSPGHRRDQFN